MKLYIPTTSLNFNNILSTDSISPKGFYSIRGFGYSRWFSIPENDMEGAILLYESPAEIIRPQSDIEDHPLLIEITTDEDFPKLKEGVRYSTHTIYLNPWHTKFMFQTEKDKITALSLSDSSLETKLMRLYGKKIQVVRQEGQFPSLEGVLPIQIDKNNIEDDIHINKVKGLLYGYYIGACLSSTKENISKLNVLREIHNIFASVVSSQDRIPTDVQMERLKSLFFTLQQEEPIYVALKKEIGNENANKAIAVLQRYGINVLRSDWKRIVDELQYESGESNYALSWINNEIKKQQLHIKQDRELLSVNKEEIISSEGKICKLSDQVLSDEDENKLYLSWINDLLITGKYSGKISSVKEELADNLTQLAITSLGDKWKDSTIRTFLNQLRRHVRGEEFTQPWENGILSSIAAVITKGDDWEPLLRFMQTKGLTDYRIAFSFYGVLNGFANLTRDFTDIILNLDSNYVSEVYREFYGQLHGLTIEVGSTHEQPSTYIPSQITSDKKDLSDLGALESFVGHAQPSENTTLANEVWMFFNSSAFKGAKNKEKLKEGLRLCLERNKDMKDPSEFVFDLNDFDSFGWSKNNKPWKTMQEKFCPDYKAKVGEKKAASSKKQETTSGFFGKALDVAGNIIDNAKEAIVRSFEVAIEEEKTVSKETQSKINTAPSSTEFINDTNIIHYLQTLNYIDSKEFEKLSRDILYIQKEYQPGGKYAKGGPKESDPSNKQVIKHLGNLVLMNRRTQKWEQIVQNLKNDLSIRYNVQ